MYRVEVTSLHNSEFSVKSKDYAFSISTTGKGISPPDALLASLASCAGVYIRKYFAGSKIAAGEFSIIAEAEFSQGPPICFKDIKVLIDLKGAKLDARRKAALLEFIKNCPVHNTLKTNPDIRINLI